MSVDYAEINLPRRERLQMLLNDLEWHHHLELLDAAGPRYSARLLELKRLGYKVETEQLEPQGKRYRMLSTIPEVPQAKRVKVLLTPNDAELARQGVMTISAMEAVEAALASFRANEHKL